MAYCNADYEPMDIDTSANSAMDISYTDIATEEKNISITSNENFSKPPQPEHCTDKPSIKIFHLDRHRKELRKTKLSNYLLRLSIFVCVILSILVFTVINIKCSPIINTGILNKRLNSNVVGQSKAVASFIKSLDTNASSKILFLYGGTGVGKTFTLSILLQDLKNFVSVYHYTMPSFAHIFSSDMMLGVTLCDRSLIVVDDLNVEDTFVTSYVKEIIDKSESLRKNVTIVLAYNCQQTNHFINLCNESIPTRLLHIFSEVKTLKFLIKFEPLSEYHLKKCIENELRHKKINNVDINLFLTHFNVSQDGCKGVYTKIKSFIK